ncbi:MULTISPECIES: hypothetical protein [unclassified Streptomyces]|uniref:hypothetical protein n=1 Tax=unclassified Streptomyces TaxID=2593676 RepID=UPI002E16847D|nr:MULTISPECIES: hypothetical protein [unclassified Streptomyces]WSR26176.1 hypothetical protein OG573_08510 [Streptomyces sp. NBC_01205]
MRSNRHVIGTIALVAALGGLAACGPQEDAAGGSPSAPSAATKPSASAPAGGSKADPSGSGGGEKDCGKPPTPPAGVKIVQVGLHRDASVFEAMDAKPVCTSNDWIYHGEGEPKGYKLPADVKGELATGPGKFQPVNRDELSKHIDGCLREDYNVVKQPYSCYGNVYEITLNSKGEVQTMRERWSV